MARRVVTRSEILDATARTLERRRIDDVSMSDIAAGAGVSKGLLYLRFADREDLIRALIDREFRATLIATHAAIDSDVDGGLLSRAYVHTISALRSRPLLFRLYTGQADDLAAFVRSQPPERYAPRVAAGHRYVAAMKESGMIRTDLGGRLGTVLSAFAIGVAAGAANLDVDEVVAGLSLFIAAGIDAEVSDTTPGKEAFATLVNDLLACVPDPTALDQVPAHQATTVYGETSIGGRTT